MITKCLITLTFAIGLTVGLTAWHLIEKTNWYQKFTDWYERY